MTWSNPEYPSLHWLVCARHGRVVMWWESPVHEPKQSQRTRLEQRPNHEVCELTYKISMSIRFHSRSRFGCIVFFDRFYEARKEAARASCIFAIVISKFFTHQLLFARRTDKVHRGKRGNQRPTCEPIRKHHALSKSPQPNGCVHGVSNPPINAVRNQLMVLSEFKASGPVLSQIKVRQQKQPERCNHDHCTGPTNRRGHIIVSKRKKRCETVEGWQQECGGQYCGEQYHFDPINLLYLFSLRFCSLNKVVANSKLDDESNEEHSVRRLKNIHQFFA